MWYDVMWCDVMYVGMHVRTFVRTYVCMCIKNIYIYICIYTHLCVFQFKYTLFCIFIYIFIYLFILIIICMRAHVAQWFQLTWWRYDMRRLWSWRCRFRSTSEIPGCRSARTIAWRPRSSKMIATVFPGSRHVKTCSNLFNYSTCLAKHVWTDCG